jgi:hypothetical protein
MTETGSLACGDDGCAIWWRVARRPGVRRRGHGGPAVDRDAVAERVRSARVRYLSDPNRPVGPSRRDQAVVMLLDELLRSVDTGLEPVRRETDEAFRQYLVERGAKPVGPD